MNICYLGLGSNQKFPERQIRQAIQSIKTIHSTYVTKFSTLYRSKAWGLSVQQDFLNLVLEINTSLSPELLLEKCRAIELKHRRIRRKKWGPRTLDIDILLYGDKIIKTSNLTIPHPHMLSRDFVMIPLLEINPKIIIPTHKATQTNYK